ELAEALWASTAGNPFYVHEVLFGLAAEGLLSEGTRAEVIHAVGSRTLCDAVNMRIHGLSAEAAALARAAAILGEVSDLGYASALAGLDHERLSRALDELVGAEVLDARTELRFRHPSVR